MGDPHNKKYIQQSKMDLAYIYYIEGKIELSIIECNNIIKEYRKNRTTEYIIYLKGLAYYKKKIFFENKKTCSVEEKNKNESIRIFRYLIKNYHNSKYKNDAIKKKESLK